MLHSIATATIRNRRVLVRVDFNVPITRGKVQDDYRIRSSVPTLTKLIKARNRVVVLSHHTNSRQTLAPVARRLGALLREKVVFIRNPFSQKVRRQIDGSAASIFFVENLRFWKGEQGKSRAFAAKLAELGDIYVNDAFGVAHRADASVALLPKLLPSFLGLGFGAELRALDRVLKHPQRPLIAIIGGAKIATKLKLLMRFSHFADSLLVGGAIANALLSANGYPVRIRDEDRPFLGSAKKIMRKGRAIILPKDLVTIARGRVKVSSVRDIQEENQAIDIGPRTIREFSRVIANARTIVWNGPLGITERREGRRATRAIARAVARSSGWSIVGGGDTVAALTGSRAAARYDHVSTGGGAMLAYLAGEKLPALEALKRNSKFSASGGEV